MKGTMANEIGVSLSSKKHKRRHQRTDDKNGTTSAHNGFDSGRANASRIYKPKDAKCNGKKKPKLLHDRLQAELGSERNINGAIFDDEESLTDSDHGNINESDKVDLNGNGNGAACDHQSLDSLTASNVDISKHLDSRDHKSLNAFHTLEAVNGEDLTNSSFTFNKYTRPFHPLTMATRTLKVGCAGLGRMGKRHADHFLHKVPRATLVAVSTPSEEELAWAKKFLEPYGVTLYKDYDQMIQHEGLQAVVIASVTTVHADQAIKATEAGMHVLCEKPLSTSVKVSQTVVNAASAHPNQKVMCGFSRRFDDSYADAFQKVQKGLIGRPSVFRSQTCDKWDPSGAFVAYAEFSGGIFVDCSIHDIDLCLWFFGPEARVKSVAAIGLTAMAPELRQYNDRDNAVGIVEFWDEKVAYFYCSRMMATGQEDTTEVIGTKGKLTVNMAPSKNLVSCHLEAGVVKEIPQDYFQRFEKAFVTEGAEFVRACLDGGELPLQLQEAVKAVGIACALQESLVTGRKIEFDEGGERKVVARAKL